ncbi:MAG: HNH endonuclease [Thermodesulfovibrionales bacterium]
MGVFFTNIDESHIKREKALARVLRQSSWWKSKIATGRCYYCNAVVSPKDLTMDHVVPIVRGGRSVKSNIVTACKTCNNKKKYLLPSEWEEYLNMLKQDKED